MDKISIEVFIPATGSSFDFLLPSTMKTGTAKELIMQAVCEEENDGLSFSKGSVLCSKDGGHVLDDQATLEQESVRDGNRLILL